MRSVAQSFGLKVDQAFFDALTKVNKSNGAKEGAGRFCIHCPACGSWTPQKGGE